ncbi:MAG TPA: hypothetical protein VN894_14160, partial [Polyangiaceae bacterium]|nr:hypothetical protein [Polyangiaceae bacterium]
VDAIAMDAHGPIPDAASCSRSSCPMGCCDLNGRCQAGIAPTACGGGGQACQSCVASGLVCTAQQCATTSCGPADCAGCCLGALCLPGNATTACGEKGSQCADCSATGAQCAATPGAGGACAAMAPSTCDSTSCPAGCCDANGVCQMGTTDVACGTFGSACENCTSFGPGRIGIGRGGPIPFQLRCTNQVCIPPPPCNCTTGCCDATGACQPGASDTECGTPYISCENCTLSGTQCSNQQCGASLDAGVCNAQSCPSGCCDSFGQCQQGITSTACGNSGTNCQTCLASNQTCSNQQCVTPPDAGSQCGPMTCGGCCDALGNCVQVFSDTVCGWGGKQCFNCAQLGGKCSAFGLPFMGPPPPNVFPGTCELPDGAVPCAQSCDGCCDVSGACQPGFINAQCGETGNACQDCTTITPPSTCDLTVSPRTCTSQQGQCPAPYPSCPAPLTQRAPTRQKVCSTTELQNAGAACAGGANTSACNAFVSFESNANPACGNCLGEFDFDFVTQVGTRACVAPFVDATCNHNSACIVDCVTQSCYACVDSASTAQCETQVQSGTCSAYFTADQCVTQALNGTGAVCNPATYQGNFGAWLQAVGAQYCGP